MYHIEIELDKGKIEERGLDYYELMNYIDYVYNLPEIKKSGVGRYDGVTCERELGLFGNANMMIEKNKEIFSVLKRWIMWNDYGGEEDIIESKLKWDRDHGGA